jgi:hypothetical protein
MLLTSCEKEDSCSTIECQNGGTCDDGTCNCPDGFIGTSCEIDCIDNISGMWEVISGNSAFCDGKTYQFDRGINTSEVKISITLTDPASSVVVGTGELSSDCLKMNYTVTAVLGGEIYGSITFDGLMLTDQVGGCTFIAEKK